MDDRLLGPQHVTALAGSLERNLAFYTGVLGLRLVQRTVNFDEALTYPLYYGDALGRPGSLLTFFIQPDTARGRQGTGQAAVVSLAIAPQVLGA